MTASRRAWWSALTALLLATAAGMWFITGVYWLVDFDNSDPSSGRAGASAVLLTVAIVVAVGAGVARRDGECAGRRTVCGVLLAGGLVAALPWLGAL